MKDQRDGPLSERAETAYREVRQAVNRPIGHKARLELEDSRVGRRTLGRGLEGLFTERAEALGVRVRETSRDDLRRVLDDLVGHHGPAVVEPALIEMFPELEGLGDSTPDDPRLTAAACGVTGVEYAIAETGSLVVAPGAGRWRQFSSVPPVHVAVVERERLVPDLLDVLLVYGGHNLPPGFVVLTGPSRGENAQRWTHGPGTVECVIVS